jgi:hypothetical protein
LKIERLILDRNFLKALRNFQEFWVYTKSSGSKFSEKFSGIIGICRSCKRERERGICNELGVVRSF